MRKKSSAPRSVPVNVSLPEPVLQWVRERALASYVDEGEYLRGVIIKMCLDDQRRGVRPAHVDTPLTVGHESMDHDGTPAENQNAELSIAATKSGFKGVYAYGKKWAAMARVNGKRQRIGVASTPEGAAALYAAHVESKPEGVDVLDETEDADIAPVRGPAPTKSGYKGVHAYNDRWAAVITEKDIQRRLGVFDTVEEAARAYDLARIKKGQSPVNFPEDVPQGRLGDDPVMAMIMRGEQPTPEDFERLRVTTGKPIPRPVGGSTAPTEIVPFTRDYNHIPDDAPLTTTTPKKRLRRPDLIAIPDSLDELISDGDPEVLHPDHDDPDPLDPNTISTGQVFFPPDPDREN